MRKSILLFLSLFLFSCSNQKAIDAKLNDLKAKRQAETGSRINDAQKNTDALFDELK